MEILDAISPLFALSGFFVGLLVGLTGVGRGSLMTPLLMLIFGIQATTAVGTDLLYAAVTKSGGTLVHHWRGTIDWQVTRRLATASIPAAIITLAVLYKLGVVGSASPPLIIAGLVLGVLVTLSSVGAGAIGMTALVLLYPRTPIAKLVGSDIAHAVPLTLIGGIGHWLLGSVNWLLLSSLLIGALPGIYVGSHFAARVPDRILRPVLAATLMLVAIRMLLS
jgi:hypothetical protein